MVWKVHTQVTGGGRRGPLTETHWQKQQILKNGSWRGGGYEEFADVPAEAVFDVDAAFVAEPGDRPAASGIDRIQEMINRVNDPSFAALAPTNDTAIHTGGADFAIAGCGIKAPKLMTCGRVERDELQLRRRAIQDTIDDKRIALNLGEVARSRIT